MEEGIVSITQCPFLLKERGLVDDYVTNWSWWNGWIHH